MSDENSNENSSSGRRDARQLIAEELDGFLTPEQTRAMLDQILAIDKPVHVRCSKCEAWIKTTVPDAKSVVSAMSDLMTQGKGRPTEQKVESSLVVNRTVVLDADAGRLRALAIELLQALETGASVAKARLEGWRAELASSESSKVAG